MTTNPLKKTVVLGILTFTMVLLLSGCASTQVSRPDPNGPGLKDNIGKLTMKDWNEVGESFIKKMQDEFINQGKLKSAGGSEKPAVMVISRFVNKTGEQIDINMLVKRIRIALLQTGKVVTDASSGLGVPEDPVADAWKRQQIFLNGGKTLPPDYSLTITIIGDRTRAGKMTEATWTFQLSLATMDGQTVWEGEHVIVKQQNRNPIGGW